MVGEKKKKKNLQLRPCWPRAIAPKQRPSTNLLDHDAFIPTVYATLSAIVIPAACGIFSKNNRNCFSLYQHPRNLCNLFYVFHSVTLFVRSRILLAINSHCLLNWPGNQ